MDRQYTKPDGPELPGETDALPAGAAAAKCLAEKQRTETLNDYILYTTLEPCVERNPPKSSCVSRTINARIRKVYIGFQDPHPSVRGECIRRLKDNNIEVDYFDADLVETIRKENEAFIKYAEEETHKVLDGEIEENSDPRADFSKLTRIAKLYFRGIRIPKFQVQEINSITFEAFVKKEIPNFTSDDRITISKDNAKLKISYTRHQDLLNRAIETLQEKGWHSCRIPSDADLLASKGRTMIILEAKSITPANQRSQIRNAVSQLYQYSYELSSKSRWKHRLVLVLERCPEDYWFEFCSYCNIELWYKENKVIIRGRRNNT